MLRWLAILSNVGLLVLVMLALNHRGMPDVGDGDFWAFAAATLFVLVNFSFIFTQNTSAEDESIFALWRKAKKAELKKRID